MKSRIALLVGALALAAYMLTPVVARAAGLAQDGGDVTSWPIIAAFLSLLAIGTVASAATALLVRVADMGLKPETLVYGVCGVLVTVGFVTSGNDLPLVDFGNPAGTVAAWMVYIKALEGFTKALYEIVLKRVWPTPAPSPTF